MNQPKFDLLEDYDKNIVESIYFIKNQKNSKLELKSQSIDNTTKSLYELKGIIDENKEVISSKKINFKTLFYHKRGRKEKENSSKKKIENIKAQLILIKF